MNQLALPLRAGAEEPNKVYDADNRLFCIVPIIGGDWRTANARAAQLVTMAEELRTLRNTYEIDRYENLRTENFLRGLGYRPCDIAACNCGSWHIDKAALAAGGETK